MNIGLNLLYLLPGIVGGTQIYAENLIQALVERDKVNQYTLFLNEESAHLPISNAPNVERVDCPVRAVSRSRRYAFEQFRLPMEVRRRKIDLLHSLGYVGPWACPCPQIVTIHDVNFVAFGSHMPASRRRALHTMTQQTARRCRRVIAVSHNSKREIVRHLQIREDKICVTQEAARPFEPVTEAHSAEVRKKYGLDGCYITAFNSLSPHKNMERLVDAFSRIAGSIPHSLVLIGHMPPGSALAQQIARHGLQDRVILTGYIPDADIPALIGEASLFVFPSLYEGFGLPVLEAQALGVPVACSTAASLPEVAGEGAEFFDPHDTQSIADSIGRLLSDEARRRAIALAGQANEARFSWTRTAEETLAVYRRILPGL